MPPSETTRERDPYIGRVIDGRFTLLSRIGKGGMGVVYRAQQAPLGRSVALKLLVGTGESEREAEFQRRFFREAATSSKLKHPNTITVFDYGSGMLDESRVFWIAMELLEGQTLSRALAKGGLAPLRAVNIGLQICRSLREAHAHGIVHRDLKPGNVMLIRQEDADDNDADFVKVLDFGLAKTVQGPLEPALTRAGTFLGSPRYVAPEQVEGRPVDARSDIYAFGCVLYRMLTGTVPFDGETAVEIMMKHLDGVPPPITDPAVPDELCELVLQCLEKKASHRPESMQELISRLKRVRQQLGYGNIWEETSDVVGPSDPGDLLPPTREAVAAPPAEISDHGREVPQPPTLMLEQKDPASWIGQVPLEETRPSRLLTKRRGALTAWLLFFVVVGAGLVAGALVGRHLGWYDDVPLPPWAEPWLQQGAGDDLPSAEGP